MDAAPFSPLLRDSAVFFAVNMVKLTVLFIGISFLVGVINEFLPQDKVKRLLSGRRGRGYVIGSVLGGLTPFCSCSTIPVTIGLLRAGAGFGPTMAFLFTSPLVNPVIIPLFLTLLGWQVTAVYAAVAVGMTITISFLLEHLGFARFLTGAAVAGQGDGGPAACCEPPGNPAGIVHLQQADPCRVTPSAAGGPRPLSIPVYREQRSRWRAIFSEAVRQFRTLLPFVILGVAIGSLIHGFLPADLVVAVAGADNPLAVPVAAIVGIPLYLRVSTMVPIAASLMAKGMSVGAVVALIIGGAGASLPEVAMLKSMFRLPLLAAFLAAVLIMAVSAGLLINAILL